MTSFPSPTATIIEASRIESKSVGVDDDLAVQDKLPRLFTKDFGVLPIPLHLRYDPLQPPHFRISLNIAFGFASTFTVANLYYCQPLLSEFKLFRMMSELTHFSGSSTFHFIWCFLHGGLPVSRSI